MIKQPKRLAIVPARGGSKRIPKKNIAHFYGRPIISYTLEAAKASGLFDLIHVSTECPLVLEVVKGLGFEPEFLRPAELAADDTPLLPVLKYVVNRLTQLGNFFDEIWLLMPCAPLIDKEDLTLASKSFAKTGGPLLSICEYPAPVEWAYKKNSDGRLYPLMGENGAKRSQDLGIKFYDAGLFAIYSSKDLMQEADSIKMLNFYGYQVERIRAIDIDYQSDWTHAEEVFKFIKWKNDRD